MTWATVEPSPEPSATESSPTSEPSSSSAGFLTESGTGTVVCSVETPCQVVEFGPETMTVALGFGVAASLIVTLLTVIAVRLLTR